MIKLFDEVPARWAIAQISDVAQVNPRLDKSKFADDLEVSFVPMPAVEAENGQIDVSGTRTFAKVKKGYTPFLEGDLLFAKITPCMENGKMAIVPTLHNDIGFGSTEFHVLRSPEEISTRFLYYIVSSKIFRIDAEHNMTGAVGQRRVPKTYLSECKIPVPPKKEQRRIVEKIEELFSELDAGVASLELALAQLKTYRQALLKHAFEGKLTAAWRAEQGDGLVSAETLLAQISAERQTRYEQQVSDWQAAVTQWEADGKPGKKPRKPAKLKVLPEIGEEDSAELPNLPDGWSWTKLDNVSSITGGLTKNSKRQAHSLKLPYLRVANVYANQLKLDDVTKIGITEGEIDRVLLQKDDLLIVEGNGSIEQIGRVAIWDGSIQNCVHQNHLIKARLGEFIKSKFMLFYLMSPIGRKFIVRQASSTSGLHTLSLSKVGGLFIPMCSTQEQIEILGELDASLSIIESVEKTIRENLQKAEALRQSILKKAFAGQLVPQDPTDEPASILLDRIQQERAAAQAAAAPSPKPKRKKRA